MRRPVAPLAAAAAALLALSQPALAQSPAEPGFLDLITPNRLLHGLAQSAVMGLRTQLDIKYGTLRVDIATGRMVMTDLRLWPLPEWEGGRDCMISIDRLTLRTNGLEEVERLRLGLTAEGIEAPQSCFPPDAAEGFALVGLDGLVAPRLNAELEYHLPGAEAKMHLHASVEGVATADATVDFSYFWFDGRDDIEDPEPVVYLRHALVKLENDGLWDALQQMLPPELAGPNGALMVEQILREAMAEINEEAARGIDPRQLSPAQEAFIASARAAWPEFLAAPEALVLETAIEGGDVYIDAEAIEEDPRALFEALRPVVALATRAARELVPAAVLRAALTGEAGALAPAERRRVGLALVTGAGAPRNLEAGLRLLAPLAEAGDGEAAMAMSRALETRAPGEAYRWALLAGAAGVPGALARLDALERKLGLAASLRLQQQVAGPAPDASAVSGLAGIRARAAAHLSGLGLSRAYGHAAFWAMLGAAAGDAESAGILAEIDARVAAADKPGRAAWAEIEARASAAATELWLARDMPAALAR